MSRSTKLREIYAELREQLGDLATPREVLKYAAGLVKLFTEEGEGPSFSLREGTAVEFSQWTLDRAFADGGWRVMYYEGDVEAGWQDREQHYDQIQILQSGCLRTKAICEE